MSISPYALVAAIKAEQHVAVNLTKKQIEGGPSLSTDLPVSRQFEEAYYGHHQWPIYKLIERTGTSSKSIEDAVNTALKRAGKTIQDLTLSWFQIVETRGSIEKNQVNHWEVSLKAGFAVEQSQAVPPFPAGQLVK